MEIKNTTILENHASVGGGAIYIISSEYIKIHNTNFGKTRWYQGFNDKNQIFLIKHITV